MKPIICFRIAWMNHYKGVKSNDIPIGAGSWIKDHKDGGEVCNFLQIRGHFYGYVRVQKDRNIAIDRLGVSKKDEIVENVLVIMFARDPHFGGQYIVGWYDDAILYRKLQKLGNNERLSHPDYFAISKISKAKLITPHNRNFRIPDDGPGESNIWYLNEYYNKQYLKEVLEYIDNPETYNNGGRNKKKNIDFELRQKVELKAMDLTEEYFVNRGFNVRYVHLEKLGWDLDVEKAGKKFHIEVKGLSKELSQFELTPNEYSKSKDLVNMYKICVVDNALNDDCLLRIFSYSKEMKSWISDTGTKLLIKEKTGALMCKNN